MNIAVLEDNKVINVVIAESIAIANDLTGLECVEITEDWDYSNGIDVSEFFPAPTD